MFAWSSPQFISSKSSKCGPNLSPSLGVLSTLAAGPCKDRPHSVIGVGVTAAGTRAGGAPRPPSAILDLRRLTDALTAATPALLFGMRLWASVCLALYVAYWLELDNPYWAGTTAALVCQPQVGVSLRKGWFRLLGRIVGAALTVVLTAIFRQDRVGFFISLALFGAICAFLQRCCGTSRPMPRPLPASPRHPTEIV